MAKKRPNRQAILENLYSQRKPKASAYGAAPLPAATLDPKRQSVLDNLYKERPQPNQKPAGPTPMDMAMEQGEGASQGPVPGSYGELEPSPLPYGKPQSPKQAIEYVRLADTPEEKQALLADTNLFEPMPTKAFGEGGRWEAKSIVERDLRDYLQQHAERGTYSTEDTNPADLSVEHLGGDNYAIYRGENERPLVLEDAGNWLPELLADVFVDAPQQLPSMFLGAAGGAVGGIVGSGAPGVGTVGGAVAGAGAGGMLGRTIEIIRSRYNMPEHKKESLEEALKTHGIDLLDIVGTGALEAGGEVAGAKLIRPAISKLAKSLGKGAPFTGKRALYKAGQELVDDAEGFFANQAAENFEKQAADKVIETFARETQEVGLEDFPMTAAQRTGGSKYAELEVAARKKFPKELQEFDEKQIREYTKKLWNILSTTGERKGWEDIGDDIVAGRKAMIELIQAKYAPRLKGYDKIHGELSENTLFDVPKALEAIDERLAYFSNAKSIVEPLQALRDDIANGVTPSELQRKMSRMFKALSGDDPLVNTSDRWTKMNVAREVLAGFHNDLRAAAKQKGMDGLTAQFMIHLRNTFKNMMREIEGLDRKTNMHLFRKMLKGSGETFDKKTNVSDLVNSKAFVEGLVGKTFDSREVGNIVKSVEHMAGPKVAGSLRRALVEHALKPAEAQVKDLPAKVGRQLGASETAKVYAPGKLAQLLLGKDAEKALSLVSAAYGGNPKAPQVEALKNMAKWSRQLVSGTFETTQAAKRMGEKDIVGEMTKRSMAIGAGIEATESGGGITIGMMGLYGLEALRSKLMMNPYIMNVLLDPRGARLLKKVFSPADATGRISQEVADSARKLLVSLGDEWAEDVGQSGTSGESGDRATGAGGMSGASPEGYKKRKYNDRLIQNASKLMERYGRETEAQPFGGSKL